ncbi:MAG: hypothetical protein JW731_04235 [Bacteroidales bacterium]|nr:hypothetical protein [Bacteroidales bacterium]
MKNYILLLIFLIAVMTGHETRPQGVAVNEDQSAPHPSAMLDVKSTLKGMLVPRMTTSQRTAISSPAEGLLVFDVTTGTFWFYESGWQELGGGSSHWNQNGNDIYYNSGNVGIGDQTPQSAFTVGDGDKFQVDETHGGISFNDPNATITFPPVSGSSNPIITMFASGTSNMERMIIAHSSDYPDWGLSYEDLSDEFHFVAGGINTITISPLGRLGIEQENPAYNLDVTGTARITGSMYLYGSVALNNSMTIAGNLNVSNDIYMSGNKGVVRGNSSTIQKVVRTSASFSATNMASNSYLISGTLSYESFGGTPTVVVGQLVSGSGEWYKIKLIPYSVGTGNCIFRLFNTASDAVTFTGTWQILIIGPE